MGTLAQAAGSSADAWAFLLQPASGAEHLLWVALLMLNRQQRVVQQPAKQNRCAPARGAPDRSISSVSPRHGGTSPGLRWK